jgi:hypothetical protein
MKGLPLIRSCVALLALSTYANAVQGEAANARCAVLGFRSSGGSDLAEQLASAISSRLTGTRGFVVVERNHLEQVVRELNLNESGMIEQEDAASFGKIKSVDYLIYGIISRPATTRSTGKDLLGARYTHYQTEITASVRYTSVKTAEIIAEPRLTGKGSGSSQVASYEDALKDIATQFVRTLVGSSKVTYAKVVKVDPTEKVVWLDQGSAQSVKKGDYYEIGYSESIELDDGKKITDFKLVCEARVDSVLDGNCKLILGKWEDGVLGIGRGFKRDDKQLAKLADLKKTYELVARQKLR